MHTRTNLHNHRVTRRKHMKRVVTPASLRFVSWNILGEVNAANNPELYRQCDPRALANRQPHIIDGILRLNPDIVGLQEVENWGRDYAPALQAAGLQGVFKQRTGDAQADGVALVWRTERLTLLHIEALSYAQLLTEGVRDRALFETFNKGNVGLLGLFRDNLNGRELVVATTHLLWNPKRGLVKLRQAQCILNRSAAMSAVGSQAEPLPLAAAASVCGSSNADTKKTSLVAAPTPKAGAAGASSSSSVPNLGSSSSGISPLRACVLLGDFNCCPGSPLYHFLLGGRLRAPLRSENTWDGQTSSHSHKKSRSQKGGNSHARLLLPPLPPPVAMTSIWPPLPTGKPSRSGGGDGGGGHGGGDRGGRALSSDGEMVDQVDESHTLLPLVSAYGSSTSGEPECTSFHGGFQGTVDYILFTQSQFRVISKLPTPSRGELRRRRSLPDMAMPSDHVPIAADLEWQEQS